jgi:hypothetical protein
MVKNTALNTLYIQYEDEKQRVELYGHINSLTYAEWLESKKNNMENKDKQILKQDNVNHPKHYTSHPSGVECIDITRHYCFSIGNAIKYLWRAGLKKEEGLEDKQKEIEDLEKSIWYIKDRIKQLKTEL